MTKSWHRDNPRAHHYRFAHPTMPRLLLDPRANLRQLANDRALTAVSHPAVVDIAADECDRYLLLITGDPAVGAQHGLAAEGRSRALLDQAQLAMNPEPASQPMPYF